MLVFLFVIKLPSFLTSAVSFTGGATTALSLISIGFMLSHAEIKKLIRKWRLIVTALIQLIVGPLLCYILLSSLHFPNEVIVVCTLIQALPTATSLGLFAAKYKGGNTVESSELVTISTLLSIGTMPLMVWLLLLR
jgi:predicted permease